MANRRKKEQKNKQRSIKHYT